MKIIKDKTGYSWHIAITVETVKRVRDIYGVEFLDAEDIDKAESFMINPDQFRNVLFCCLSPIPQTRRIFDRAFTGEDVIFAAANKFLEELCSFFPVDDEEQTESLVKDNSSSDVDTWDFIWQVAGILGVNPLPLTLRELVIMNEARGKNNWNHTGSVLAMLFNCNRDPQKQSAKSADDFNPYVTGGNRDDEVEWLPAKETNEILKKAFGING